VANLRGMRLVSKKLTSSCAKSRISPVLWAVPALDEGPLASLTSPLIKLARVTVAVSWQSLDQDSVHAKSSE
jgi:hypothetical protein